MVFVWAQHRAWHITDARESSSNLSPPGLPFLFLLGPPCEHTLWLQQRSQQVMSEKGWQDKRGPVSLTSLSPSAGGTAGNIANEQMWVVSPAADIYL